MTAVPRAADLPVGSVIATSDQVWIRRPNERGLIYYCWQPGNWHHDYIDQMLADGAQVLRVGDGTEEG